MSEQLRLHQLRFTPLNITVKKIVRKLLSRLITPLQRREHYFKQTYSADIKHSSFHRFIHSPITLPVENQRIILAVCEHYSHHQYSLLGSGWVSLLHGAESKGFEGYRYDSRSISHSDSNGEWLAAHINSSNLRYAQTAWQHIPKPYQPLDWQRDCRSGFRWDSKQWHGELTISQGNGADPKLPWEFGRMHSLLHLALKYS
ncbi:MAG: hypothetical protein JNL32_02960, partial [Candidatus Kapabacteria bacterium]|nr:hypothetical protein [Candidatus Kapabacteria bacterium]